MSIGSLPLESCSRRQKVLAYITQGSQELRQLVSRSWQTGLQYQKDTNHSSWPSLVGVSKKLYGEIYRHGLLPPWKPGWVASGLARFGWETIIEAFGKTSQGKTVHRHSQSKKWYSVVKVVRFDQFAPERSV